MNEIQRVDHNRLKLHGHFRGVIGSTQNCIAILVLGIGRGMTLICVR
jgi:hypothetical protein